MNTITVKNQMSQNAEYGYINITIGNKEFIFVVNGRDSSITIRKEVFSRSINILPETNHSITIT